MSILARVLPADVSPRPVGWSSGEYNAYEAAPYTVERRLGDVEIRAYAPHILAEVRLEGDRQDALGRGFRLLAGYIFGANTAREKVAMTVPVRQSRTIDMTVPVRQSGGDGTWTVSFMMPSRWTLETLPRPTSEEITLRETDPSREAVLAFSGRATGARQDRELARLKAALDGAGLSPAGPVRLAYYDDPWTLPWARRNEVALPLD